MGTRSNPQCLLRWRTTDTATRTLATRTRHTVGTAMATPMPLPMLPPTLLRHTPVMATATPTAPPMPGTRTAMGMATATPTAAMDMATATPTAAMDHTDMGTRTTR